MIYLHKFKAESVEVPLFYVQKNTYFSTSCKFEDKIVKNSRGVHNGKSI